MAWQSFLFAGIGILGLSLILQIVALATTHWATTSLNILDVNFNIYFGLFRTDCTFNSCSSYLKVPSSFRAVQALVLIGLLISVAQGVMAALVFLLEHKRASTIKFHLFALVAGILGGMFIIVGCLIFKFKAYADMVPLDGYLQYSFFLAIAGAVLSSASGGFIFRAGRLHAMQQ